MPTIDIDQETDDYLTFAARVARITKGEVVAQLVELAKAEQHKPEGAKQAIVPIFADYEGHRTRAEFTRGVGRIKIVDGPLADSTFKTPSEAAREVVSHYNPGVSANRNGWSFWMLGETGAPLQTIRYEDV